MWYCISSSRDKDGFNIRCSKLQLSTCLYSFSYSVFLELGPPILLTSQHQCPQYPCHCLYINHTIFIMDYLNFSPVSFWEDLGIPSKSWNPLFLHSPAQPHFKSATLLPKLDTFVFWNIFQFFSICSEKVQRAL